MWISEGGQLSISSRRLSGAEPPTPLHFVNILFFFFFSFFLENSIFLYQTSSSVHTSSHSNTLTPERCIASPVHFSLLRGGRYLFHITLFITHYSEKLLYKGGDPQRYALFVLSQRSNLSCASIYLSSCLFINMQLQRIDLFFPCHNSFLCSMFTQNNSVRGIFLYLIYLYISVSYISVYFCIFMYIISLRLASHACFALQLVSSSPSLAVVSARPLQLSSTARGYSATPKVDGGVSDICTYLKCMPSRCSRRKTVPLYFPVLSSQALFYS